MIVSKTERLTKADKFELKKQSNHQDQSFANSSTNQVKTPKMTHRVTSDFSSLNTLTSTRKYVSMPSINDVAAKVKDSYCSTLANKSKSHHLDTSVVRVF